MKSASDSSRAAFRSTITAARNKLLEDIRTETAHRYSLAAGDRTKIHLRPGEEADWAILEPHIGELDTLIRERAYTTANRLAFLFLLEARGLRPINLVLRGTALSPLKDNYAFFTDLLKGPDQGWAYFLDQVWDSLSGDLPALFTRTPLQDCVPLPGTTLIWLINEFAKAELADVWLDDTTPGWLYQYWNDPDRKAVDEKLKNTTGKVEAGELAHKTQLFTERYMVEWLVQNSLGAQWLCLCAKKNWHFSTDHGSDFWKFYVQQDLSLEAISSSPDRVADFRILDPAMGSGHFLVYVFDFLFMLYNEEARLSNTSISDEAILDSIFENNIHGIDIDSRAVQIAAASLFVKAWEHAGGYRFKKLNLVATDLGLSSLADDDAALLSFIEIMQKEAGIVSSLSLRIVHMLKTADYMGSLLQVNEEILKIATLYSTDEDITDTIMRALARFVKKHDSGTDLGLHTLAEQLEKGIRLIKILDTKFDVIVANPPYLTRGKTDEKLDSLFYTDDNELYQVMVKRAKTLLKKAGYLSFVTTHNYMFLDSYKNFRAFLQENGKIHIISQLGVWTFADVSQPGALGIALLIWQNGIQDNKPAMFQRIGTGQHRTDPKFNDKIPYLISQCRTYPFPQERFADIPGSPMIYWWPEEFRTVYLKAKKLGEVGETWVGYQTCYNDRFIRLISEIQINDIEIIEIDKENCVIKNKKWMPYMKGGKGQRWFEPLVHVIKDRNLMEVDIFRDLVIHTTQTPNREHFYEQGISFNKIGTGNFICRLRKYKSIYDNAASTIFLENNNLGQVLLSSSLLNYVLQSINPTINNQNGDIEKLPILDLVQDYQTYLNRACSLYDELFASTESNLEYRYGEMEEERFEVEEARIRDEIDKEILSHFSAATIASIYEEIGESPFDYPARTEGLIPADFADAYQKSDGILELAHRYRLHPDSIIDIKNETGLIHQSQRQAKAFKNLSWALGVLMGRFDIHTGGLLDLGPGIVEESPEGKTAEQFRTRTWNGKPGDEKSATADFSAGPQHPHGLIYLSILDDDEGFTRDLDWNSGKECIERLRAILRKRHGEEKEDAIWQEIKEALVQADGCENVGEWIRHDAFARHKEIYENRPIYFPLVSAKKNFFLWVNIHRWNDGTLNAILANYLKRDRDMLEARVRRLREDIVQTDDKRVKIELEDTVDTLGRLYDELVEFADLVTKIAQKGPAPDIQEVEAPFTMDLDDGVMVNSAAIWELVFPLWKDPKKWWEVLSKPSGKKDFDWSHLAMRYWPERVLVKVNTDPSLAVAHSDYGVYKGKDLFAKFHPAAAKKWKEMQGKKIEEKFVKRDAGELEF